MGLTSHPDRESCLYLNFHFLIHLFSSALEFTLHLLFEHLYLVPELFLKTGHITCNFCETVENSLFVLWVFFLAQVPLQEVFNCLLLIIISSFYFSVQRS